MPCEAAKPAVVVYGKQLGRKLTVCTDNHCPVHDPQAAAEAAADPVPTITPAPEIETGEKPRNVKPSTNDGCASTRPSKNASF
jgi:ParB family chromosome partitioning protein